MEPYPFFVPPPPFLTRDHAEWTPATAKAYLRWYLDVIPLRLEILQGHLDLRTSGDAGRDLRAFGERAAAAIRTAPFSEPDADTRTLTNRGFALAADVGTLMATGLARSCWAPLAWSVAKGPRRYVSRNLPVLGPFGKVEFDPMLISTSLSWGVVTGERTGAAWFEVYEVWREMAGESVSLGRTFTTDHDEGTPSSR